MKVLFALPGRMAFARDRASSIELCVAEWISESRYRQRTTVLAEESSAEPLLELDIRRLKPVRYLASWHQAHAIRRLVRFENFDLIVAQQHIATAARIAICNPKTPVILQVHNFVAAPVRGRGAALRNRLRAWELNRLAGMTLVSEAVLRKFEADWPSIGVPRVVIPNGFDFSGWRTDRQKRYFILVVGRAHHTKGTLEAAAGVAQALLRHPHYSAIFILSETDRERAYFAAVLSALQPVLQRCEILTDIGFARVKDLTETAAISVVASTWPEPFGRTALEAHAGGAALLSSGTGGLREVSGDAALYLSEVTGDAIAERLERLIEQKQLRQALAGRGAERVRSLFSLSSIVGDGAGGPSVCARLDRFLADIHASRNGVVS